MNNWTILALQMTVSSLAALLIFFQYLLPRLSRQPFELAILPMLLIQAYRFTGLTLLVSGQADPALPQDALAQMAWGDFATAVIALIAAYAAWRRSRFTVPLVWIFVVVCFADFANVGRQIINIGFFNYDIGSTWTFLTWYLPWGLLSPIYVVYRLFNREPTSQTAEGVMAQRPTAG